MYSEYHHLGTVSISGGSTIVTGLDTSWTFFGVDKGELFVPGFPSVPDITVIDDTTIEMPWPWQHANVSNSSYRIGLVSAEQATLLQTNTLQSHILARNVAFAFDADADGSLGGRDAFDAEPEGFRYGVFEDAENPVFYRKNSDTSGDWTGPFKWRGPAGSPGIAAVLNWIDAGWADDTAYSVNDGLAHNGTSYRARVDHTSSADTEPGMGADWQTVWEVAASKGAKGDKGWAIEPELVSDGGRVVIRVADFIGGEGDQPSGEGLYIGSGGLTPNIAAAIDIRGFTGPQGDRGINWRGAWDSGASYDPYDLVTDPDALDEPAAWIALTENTNSKPRDNATDWVFFPGSFPSALDYGLITAATDAFRDYGSIV